MITAEQACSFEAVPRQVVPAADLTDEETVALEYADSVVESQLYRAFDGGVFSLVIPAGLSVASAESGEIAITPQVIEALRARYETGGWMSAVLPIFADGSADTVREFRFVLAPKTGEITAPKKESRTELPPMFNPDLIPAHAPRLLVRMPTRARPGQALRVLEKYRSMAGYPVQIEVVIDDDDPTMNNSQVLQRLNALDCVVTSGPHKSKVEAVNAGRVATWDILLLASDDMVPVFPGYAAEVLKAMEDHWPCLDGAVFFDDGYAHDRCCTLPIIGKRLYRRMGYIYDPAYKSLWCDMEQTEVLRGMKRLVYVDKMLIEHRHPETRKADKDGLHVHNYTFEAEDRATYESRKASGFDAEPPWLSICIATVANRSLQLNRLLAHLDSQSGGSINVEYVIDGGPGSIGEKRQRMIERATGIYVAHIDDDDWVPHNYVRRVLAEVLRDPLPDAVSLTGVLTTNGERPETFSHSIKNGPEWRTVKGVHLRGPNHLNVVKRELALKAGFTGEAYGEDHEYAKRLFPLIKTESDIGPEPMYFYWQRTKERLGA